jgi:hypothetical protein
MSDTRAPTVFISYAWEDAAHHDWVRNLAERLTADGVRVRLDQWELGVGDNVGTFIDGAIRESDFVLCICTPTYAQKSNSQIGGVAYERQAILTAMTATSYRKLIPVVRRGTVRTALPGWLRDIQCVDFSADPYSSGEYERLLRVLYSSRPHVMNRESDATTTPSKPIYVPSELTEQSNVTGRAELEELTGAPHSADSLYVLADLGDAPADLLVQLMRDLNDLHIALGGAGLHIRSVETGATVTEGAIV